jgi:hypothetical protein
VPRGRPAGPESAQVGLTGLLLGLVGVLATLAGCAKPGPPPGGPVDEDAPWVVSTDPADRATSVPPDVGVLVFFSEEMDRPSVERSVTVEPEVVLRSARWKGPRFELRPAAGLVDSTTYVITLGESARDYHGVEMGKAVTFAFSTGPAMDDCGVTGVVRTDGGPVSGATIWACADSPEPDSLGIVTVCGRAATSRADGTYVVRFLDAGRSPYSLVAFIDADRDGAYSLTDESGAVLADAAVFAAPGDTARGIDMTLEPPPGGEPPSGAETSLEDEPPRAAEPSDEGAAPLEGGTQE